MSNLALKEFMFCILIPSSADVLNIILINNEDSHYKVTIILQNDNHISLYILFYPYLQINL